MSDSVILCALIVFKHEQVFDFQMPNRVIKCSGSVSNAALRTATSCGLEHLVERDDSSMVGISISNGTSKCADTSCSDADAGFLTNILNNTASSSINTIKAVVCFNKYAT